jgi:hypothetical protein
MKLKWLLGAGHVFGLHNHRECSNICVFSFFCCKGVRVLKLFAWDPGAPRCYSDVVIMPTSP